MLCYIFLTKQIIKQKVKEIISNLLAAINFLQAKK